MQESKAGERERDLYLPTNSHTNITSRFQLIFLYAGEIVIFWLSNAELDLYKLYCLTPVLVLVLHAVCNFSLRVFCRIQIFDASLCGVSVSADCLQRFFKHSLTQTLTYKPRLKGNDLSQALSNRLRL